MTNKRVLLVGFLCGICVILLSAFQAIVSFNALTIAPNATRTAVGQLKFRDLSPGPPGHFEGFQAFNPLASNITWTWPPQDLFGCWQSDGAGNLSIGPCLNSAGVNVQTGATYTFANSDCGKLAVFSSSSAVAVTLPQAGVGGNFKNGCLLSYSNIGTGTVTITATTSTIDNIATPVTVAGNQIASPQGGWIFSNGSNYFTNRGMFRIGAITAGHLGLFDIAGSGYMADAGVVPPTPGSGGTGPFGCGSFFQEVPSGLMNGSNTVFNLTYKPSPVSIMLFLDGIEQQPDSDYTLASDGTITFTVAPKSTDLMKVEYFRCELAGSSGGGGGSLGARRFSSAQLIEWNNVAGTNITGDLSIGMWVSLPTNATGILMSRYDNSNPAPYPFIIWMGGATTHAGVGGNGDPGTIAYTHTYGGGPGADAIHWNDAVPLASWTSPTYVSNGWHYIGISRNSSAKTVSLYVGDASSMSLISTQSYSHTPDANTGTNGVWTGSIQGGCGGCDLVAAVQEHYIWSANLTQAQHLQAARGNASPTSLQLKCLMGNNPEVDLSTNGASGTLVGPPPLVQGH